MIKEKIAVILIIIVKFLFSLKFFLLMFLMKSSKNVLHNLTAKAECNHNNEVFY